MPATGIHVLLAVGVMLAVSGPARAADCALADLDYNGACGPEFQSPAWGDAAGWTDPSKYSTIQLADITGDGRRADRPDGRRHRDLGLRHDPRAVAAGARCRRAAAGARDARSPLPNEDVRGSWGDRRRYSTIQAADLVRDGPAGDHRQRPERDRRVSVHAPGGHDRSAGARGRPSARRRHPAGRAVSRRLPEPPGVGGGRSAGTVARLPRGNKGWTSERHSSRRRRHTGAGLTDPQYYLNNMPALMSVRQPAADNCVPANVTARPKASRRSASRARNWQQSGHRRPAATMSEGELLALLRRRSQIRGGRDPGRLRLQPGVLRDAAGRELLRRTVRYGRIRPRPSHRRPARRRARAEPLAPTARPGWTRLHSAAHGLGDPSREAAARRVVVDPDRGRPGDGETEVLAVLDGQLRAWE